eukprot:TRINITY_DN1707_c0_g1_i1.p1 TRINITY_DN1707_c0_g1~~TRINITY_DN1707_c0_g1_i1.p1  ORF type:complete len:524 (+),score=132.25 TRINITY_DN1707_c0_g1_i1:52-1623(+)
MLSEQHIVIKDSVLKNLPSKFKKKYSIYSNKLTKSRRVYDPIKSLKELNPTPHWPKIHSKIDTKISNVKLPPLKLNNTFHNVETKQTWKTVDLDKVVFDRNFRTKKDLSRFVKTKRNQRFCFNDLKQADMNRKKFKNGSNRHSLHCDLKVEALKEKKAQKDLLYPPVETILLADMNEDTKNTFKMLQEDLLHSRPLVDTENLSNEKQNETNTLEDFNNTLDSILLTSSFDLTDVDEPFSRMDKLSKKYNIVKKRTLSGKISYNLDKLEKKTNESVDSMVKKLEKLERTQNSLAEMADKKVKYLDIQKVKRNIDKVEALKEMGNFSHVYDGLEDFLTNPQVIRCHAFHRTNNYLDEILEVYEDPLHSLEPDHQNKKDRPILSARILKNEQEFIRSSSPSIFIKDKDDLHLHIKTDRSFWKRAREWCGDDHSVSERSLFWNYILRHFRGKRKSDVSEDELFVAELVREMLYLKYSIDEEFFNDLMVSIKEIYDFEDLCIETHKFLYLIGNKCNVNLGEMIIVRNE